jgi:hypothetical protein
LKDNFLTIRVSTDELQRIRRLAKIQGVSQCSYIRSKALESESPRESVLRFARELTNDEKTLSIFSSSLDDDTLNLLFEESSAPGHYMVDGDLCRKLIKKISTNTEGFIVAQKEEIKKEALDYSKKENNPLLTEDYKNPFDDSTDETLNTEENQNEEQG